MKDGDKVSVNYIGMLEDNTVFDTNIEIIAKENNIYDSVRNYKPLVFTIGLQNVVPGFEKNIKMMDIGENKIFTLLPEEAYGEIKEELILTDLKREIEFNRTISIPNDIFVKTFGEEPEINKEISLTEIPWTLIVKEINENVVLENNLREEQEVYLPGTSWPAKVIKITENKIIFFQLIKEGDIILMQTQPNLIRGKVTRINESSYDLDMNHPLAGKVLIFNVTLINIEKFD